MLVVTSLWVAPALHQRSRFPRKQPWHWQEADENFGCGTVRAKPKSNHARASPGIGIPVVHKMRAKLSASYPLLRPPSPDQAQLTAAEAAADKQAGQGGVCFNLAVASASCTCLSLLKSIPVPKKLVVSPGGPESIAQMSILCLTIPLPPPCFPSAEEDGDDGVFPPPAFAWVVSWLFDLRFGSAGAGWEGTGCSLLPATAGLCRLDGGFIQEQIFWGIYWDRKNPHANSR